MTKWCQVPKCKQPASWHVLCSAHLDRVGIRAVRKRPPWIVDPSGCWLWEWSTIGSAGYGKVVRWDGRHQYAHRRVYEMFKGPIPDGLTVDHLCMVRNCVNPKHLEAVTLQENIRRARRAKQAQP